MIHLYAGDIQVKLYAKFTSNCLNHLQDLAQRRQSLTVELFVEDTGDLILATTNLERFSFECRKVIGFALSTRCDWLKRFAPPFHPIRSKTKANCDALACIFPRFASATCNYFEF